MKTAKYDHSHSIREHLIAERIVGVIRQRLLMERERQGLTETELGQASFKQTGLIDLQKKVNNLINGNTKMCLTDFYLLCSGLKIPADRIFASAIDEAIMQVDAEMAAFNSKNKEHSKKNQKKSAKTSSLPPIQPPENENSHRH